MKIFSFLIRRLKKRIPALIVMILANAGSALFSVVFALGFKGVINGAVSGSSEALLRACLAQLGIISGLLICLTISRYLQHELTALLDRDWKQNLLHDILRGDYAEVSRFHSGELINRMNNDVRMVNDGLLATLPGFVGMVVRLIAAAAFLIHMEPRLMAVMAVAGVVVIFATGLIRKRLHKLNKQVNASDGVVSGFLQESLEKLMMVQAMDVAAEIERRADIHLEKRYRLQRKRRRISLLSSTSISILFYASGFLALVWSAFGMFRGTMTFGDLTAITQLTGQLRAPFSNLSGYYPQYIAMVAAGERLQELEELCRNSADEDSCDHTLYSRMTRIYAEDLTFSYDRDQILAKSSFHLPKGAFAVVTGPSGIGKSTIFKLLLGIFHPNGGKLQVETDDGSVEISRATRKLFAYVPQGNLLFSGTLRENLLLTCPEATEDQIQQAVWCSCMDGYLPQLPDGLETVLGENAHGLSEGQAQRLAIARAVLSGAPILLLDEVTSALDAETERLVLQRLQKLPDRTYIAVTHRPAAMELANWQLHVDKDGVHCRPLGAEYEKFETVQP